MQQATDESRELEILETVASDPEVRQVDIATQLGVAVGTVNWVLKRLISKGYVKAKRIGRWQWRYLLTPKGVARKARLTRDYVQYSMSLYRDVRRQASDAVKQVVDAGFDALVVEAARDDEITDVYRLTCHEHGLRILASAMAGVPVLQIDGRHAEVVFPGAGRGEDDESSDGE
jgi:predicted ArsR family transcriptional regulator